MPLYKLSAAEAIGNRKSNAKTGWGNRATQNRVEPIARPEFSVPFKISPATKIFTVGSCFARNVEDELMRRGFDLPMRRLFSQENNSAFLNNYGTPSIYNEFAWAFGEREYVSDDHIVEIQKGRYADIHLSPSMRPEPHERVLARRRAIGEAYRTAAECPILIMTLGLSEAWFDTKTGYYLNVAPRPSHLSSEPQRFEMHVLSFEETFDFLERAILIVKNNRGDVQILLTVSPVPLTATHRDSDVMAANAYSKAVLRVAAETLVARHDFVTYYPSYESVTLSDRKRAWRDDFVHVTHELVAFNVGRMVDAYIGGGEDMEQLQAAIAEGGLAVAVEKARNARAGSRERAAAFFEEFGQLSRQSAQFAMEHSYFLADVSDFAGVLRVLDHAPADDLPEIQSLLLRSEALIATKNPMDAVNLLALTGAKLDGPHAKRLRVPEFWYAYLDAAMATGEASIVEGVLSKFLLAVPPHASHANTRVGRWFQERGELDRAIAFYEMAIAEMDETGKPHLYLVECLLAQGKVKKARELLTQLRPKGPGIKFLYDRLSARLEESATSSA